jgi:hypothetical protein
MRRAGREWLKNRALASEGMSARTYVVCAHHAPQRVVGYYAISTAMEQRIALPNAKLRRAMPDQVPDDAVRLCQQYGFLRCPLGDRVMLLPIELAILA